MSVYLDASVAVAFLAAERRGEQVRDWLLAQPSGSLVISHWVDTEVSGALARKRRMGELSPEEEITGRTLWHSAQLAVFRCLSVSAVDFSLAASFCARRDLTLRGADALHLAIVERERLTLATFDHGMAQAARQIGLPLETMLAG